MFFLSHASSAIFVWAKWKMKVCRKLLSCSGKKHKKTPKRNLERRLRRRRSKLRYYSRLRVLRLQRETDDLCASVAVFDVIGMEWSPLVSNSALEVAEWHKQEQIAFWKSRALSLEYENKMLLQHIRNVYAKQTEDYASYLKQHGESEEGRGEEQREAADAPTKRRAEMEKLYGKKAAKIMGMETAVQLNYDLHLEDAGKISHWPHMPLNLKFE